MAARFLLDSDICVYLLSGRHPNLVRTFDRKLPRQVGVSVIVMGELLAGHDDTRRHFRDPRGGDFVLRLAQGLSAEQRETLRSTSSRRNSSSASIARCH